MSHAKRATDDLTIDQGLVVFGQSLDNALNHSKLLRQPYLRLEYAEKLQNAGGAFPHWANLINASSFLTGRVQPEDLTRHLTRKDVYNGLSTLQPSIMDEIKFIDWVLKKYTATELDAIFDKTQRDPQPYEPGTHRKQCEETLALFKGLSEKLAENTLKIPLQDLTRGIAQKYDIAK